MDILITGATGFLGKHIYKALADHNIFTLGRNETSSFKKDISKEFSLDQNYFDLVVHTAGKAHVIPKSESDKAAFFNINEKGTDNLLAALESNPPKHFIFISTVAVYGLDSGTEINEECVLSGHSPYALSKINAEKKVIDWCIKYSIHWNILRLPLISGDNPPGNLKKMIKGIQKGYYMRIGEGTSRKSMVSARDVAELISQIPKKSGVYNLTDGRHPSIAETDSYIANGLNKRIKSIPLWIAKLMALIGDILPFSPVNSAVLRKLNSTLTFSDEKARKEINWDPSPALEALTFNNE